MIPLFGESSVRFVLCRVGERLLQRIFLERSTHDVFRDEWRRVSGDEKVGAGGVSKS